MIAADTLSRARAVTISEAAHRLGIKLPRAGEYAGPCPACGGRDRFSVNPRKGGWNCRGARGGRDAISLVEHVLGVDFQGAVAFLAGETVSQAPLRPTPAPATAGDDDAERIARARKLFTDSIDPRNALVQTYLETDRGLHGALTPFVASQLRFAPRCAFRTDDGSIESAPAMIAAFRNVRSVLAALLDARGDLAEAERRVMGDVRNVTGVHRTRLTPEGRKVARKMLGPTKGSAIFLSSPLDGIWCGQLTIAEGIESALSAAKRGFLGVMALGSSGAIASFEPFPLAALYICAETDDTSRRDVEKCAEAWTSAGVAVHIVEPTKGVDLNDLDRGIAA